MTTKSLFGSAKVQTPSASKTKEKNTIILDENRFPNIGETMNDFIHGNLLLKQTEAEVKMCHSQIIEAGKQVFIEECINGRRYSGSFNLATTNGAKVMFVPMDKYTKVEADKFDYLVSKYGADYVKEKTEYSFNSEVLERNQEILEQLIMNCDQISDYDKANLLTAKVSYEVKKGSIELLHNFANPTEALNDFSPIFSIKNV